VPEDVRVLEASRRGQNVFTLPEDTPAFQTVRALVGRLIAAPHARGGSKRKNQEALEDR
jgi:hypothetical protein